MAARCAAGRAGARGAGARAGGGGGLRGAGAAARAKPDIHPEWHPEAEVVCNGEVVMKVSGTKARYDVDVYSGNHPFYKVRALESPPTHTRARARTPGYLPPRTLARRARRPLPLCLAAGRQGGPLPPTPPAPGSDVDGVRARAQGGSGNLVVDEGRLNKFKGRFGDDDMDFLMGSAKGISDSGANADDK